MGRVYQSWIDFCPVIYKKIGRETKLNVLFPYMDFLTSSYGSQKNLNKQIWPLLKQIYV